jgi:kynurenine formamidase/D-alanyl-D-alanine dipeptidase
MGPGGVDSRNPEAPVRIRTACILLCLVASLGRAEGPPQEPGAFRVPDLVELATLDATIRLDVRYATPGNFTGRAVYPEARVFLQRPAAEALVRVQRALREKGYGLLVFDGYRPWRITKLFWDITPAEKRTFVADPAKGSKHNRGCAVDLSLVDLKSGKEVEMPGAYDEMSERSYPTYGGGTKAQREARDVLRAAMEREGFFVYAYEWWHFDYKDWLSYPILDLPFSQIARSAPPRPPLDVARATVVDLTHPFDRTTLYWPNVPSGFELKSQFAGTTPGGWHYEANTFCAPEHGGTHLDAPIHFAAGADRTEALELERLVAPVVVIDATKQADADADFRLRPEDVLAWERTHGAIPKGSAVLLRTGWSARWPDRKRYFGDDVPGRTDHLHFPAYGKEAVELLVKERGVAALGLDTPSLDHGPSTDFPVHRVAGAANVPGFENLAGLDRIPATGAWLVALPMKIAGGSGGPLRAIALLPLPE